MRPSLSLSIIKALKAKLADPNLAGNPIAIVENRYFLCAKKPFPLFVELEGQAPKTQGYAIKKFGMSALGIYDAGGGWLGDQTTGSFKPPQQTPGMDQGTSGEYLVKSDNGTAKFRTIYRERGAVVGENEWTVNAPPAGKSF